MFHLGHVLLTRVVLLPRAEPSAHSETLVNNHGHAYPNPGRAGSNGIGGLRFAALAAAPSLPHGYSQAATSQNEEHIDPELRSTHELQSPNYPPPPTMIPAGVPPPPTEQMSTSSSATIVGYVDAGDSGADGRKAKRELSQSKRAAQNRAAQVSSPRPVFPAACLALRQPAPVGPTIVKFPPEVSVESRSFGAREVGLW